MCQVRGANKVVEQYCGLGNKLTNLPGITDNDDNEDQELGSVKIMHELYINRKLDDDSVCDVCDDENSFVDDSKEDEKDGSKEETHDDCFDD